MIEKLKVFLDGDSPKGKFRMWQLIIIATFLFLIVHKLDHILLSSWGSETLFDFAKAAAFNTAWYYYWSRVLMHKRTHNIENEKDKSIRESLILVTHSFVTCAALIS